MKCAHIHLENEYVPDAAHARTRDWLWRLVLIGAFVLMEKGLAEKYGAGMFADPREILAVE